MSEFDPRNISNYCRVLSTALCEVTEQRFRLEQSPVALSKTQFTILRILNSAESLRVNEVAEYLRISGAAASKNVDFLYGKKLIGRKVHSKDRRMAQVSLLEKGRRIVNDYQALCRSIHSKALEGFSQEEQDTLAYLLGRYVQHALKVENISLHCLTCNGELNKNCQLGGPEELCHCFYS